MSRRRWFVAGLVVGFSLLGLGSSSALAEPPSLEKMLSPDHLPGELLVKFREGAPEPAARSLRVQLAARVATRFRSGAEHWLLGPGHGVEEGLRLLVGHPLVAYAEPNYRVFPVRTPDDPNFSALWGLHNTGQFGGIPGADIDAQRAWDLTTGDRRVRVAVIDTGVEAAHPDLAAQIWTNPGEIPGNGLDDDANGYVDDAHGWDFCDDDNDPADDHGHGTHVSGTIGAIGNNGRGVVGVAWSVSIVPIKFLCNGWGTNVDAIASIEYATALGVDVMNNSWGGGEFSQAMLDAINAAAQREILFVAAAGNNTSDNDLWPFYPATYNAPNLVSVAATGGSDELAWFSNWGAQSVDLGAPGIDIYSTYMGGTYGYMNGTSMATPHVSGVAALMRALVPDMGVVELRQLLFESVEPVASLGGITATGGRLDAFQALSGIDGTPPAAVGDLAVEGTTSSSVTLTWSAPGDDGDQGTASAYDLRYSTAPIDAGNFAAATPAPAPAPQPAGSRQQVEVGGLDAASSYHFALVGSDEVGNAGPLSNVVSGTTLAPPTIATAPASFSASLITGARSNQVLTIENVGVGTLDWVIPPPERGAPPAKSASDQMSLGKGEPDPRKGPAPASLGGPDPFGYRFIDSDEPDGPPFEWVDISGSGTAIAGLTGDDQSVAIPIGFPFDFYGTRFEFVNVATNGFLSFTNGSAEFNNQPLPGSLAPEFLIAPFWDDLDFGGQARASYLIDGSCLTIQFTNVARQQGDGVFTFQVSLYHDGGIVLRYQSMSGLSDSATIGIQDGTQSRGLQVVFNAPYVHDGLAIRIYRTPDWLRAAPTTGRLWSGERAEVTVTIDAARLFGGHYDGFLTVDSNDPQRPSIPHPVSLDVTAAPDIAVSPATLDFGPVLLGESRSLPLAVSNDGTEPLQVDSIGSDRSEFVPDHSSLALSPFDAETVVVVFTPAEIGAFEGTLTLASDDPDEPVTTVRLAGVGAVPPRIEVAPPELDATLNQFAQETQPLTVSNVGGLVLDFTAEVVPRGPGLQRSPFAGLSTGDGRSDNAAPSNSGNGPAAPSAFHGADASFEPLPASPAALTCVVGDPEGRAVYAQANQGYDFFRFRPETGAWETLSGCPLHSGNNGGAALLGGAVYTSYTASGTELGVYDVTTDSWTSRPHPLGGGTANIASDGTAFLYFALGRRLVRYDPASGEQIDLAAPPFDFEPWGGLAYNGGRLYGHEGNGLTGFAVYEVAHDVWRELPPIPAGAAAGAAIDPLAQEYAAAGPYGGSNLYRFSLADESWRVSTLPFFVGDGGLGWLPGRPSGLYVVQGEDGLAFTRLVGAPSWLRVTPDSGSVPPGSAAVLEVTFDSAPLLGGDYAATIEIRSNDPLTPLVSVPADLTVTGVPDIALAGVEQRLESAIDYGGSGALTPHSFWIVVPPTTGGTIELVADGDYGYETEQATASAEGLTLGTVGSTGLDCSAASGRFPIAATDLAALAADGVVRVDVQNSAWVEVFCAVNRHTVRLRYRGAADRLEFGELFPGQSRILELEVRNGGSSPLEISSIVSDLPEFVPSATSLGLAPHATVFLAVQFTPGAVGTYDGTLTFTSNDPDEPVVTVALSGAGVEPPQLTVTPSGLSATLDHGNQETQLLTLSNSGGGLLEYTAEVVPRGADLVRTTYSALSAGGPSNNPPPAPSGAPPAEPPPFRGADAAFELLPPSPAALTCVVADPSGRAIYAQQQAGTRFFRYRPENRAWEPLSPAPIYPGNNGGAALLGGTIFTTYNDWGSLLGVYDIATDSWSTRPHPLGGGTSNVASDGTRYLYFALGTRLVRYDPASQEQTELAVPPFAFESWGGLAYSNGLLYGHAGNGRVEFATYDIAGDAWRLLPQLPGGAVLGAAIDPLAQEYAAVGPYYGTNLYRFSLIDETWSVSSLPFLVDDSGLAWLPGRPSGLYIVQGERGAAFARLVGAPAWLQVSPDAGSVPPGGSADLQVTFDSSLLPGGEFGAEIEIRSNDPLASLVSVPADLTVTGAPDIAMLGAAQRLESAVDYRMEGAVTQHQLTVTVPPGGDGEFELVADGDYGDPAERAYATADGLELGSVGAVGSDCVPATGRFPLGAEQLAALAADGFVNVEVRNDWSVGVFCGVNRHTVRLHYRAAADRLDFGAHYLGLSPVLEIEVRNDGIAPLEVSSITSDLPEFVPSASSLTLAPRTTTRLSVTFTPSAGQAFDGILTLVSNDPDEPLVTVALYGEGVVPPAISIDPLSYSEALNSGETTVRTLTIANSGGDTLRWTAEIDAAEAGRLLSASPTFGGLEPQAGQPKDETPAPQGPPTADRLYTAEFPAAPGPADSHPTAAPRPPLEDLLPELDAGYLGITSLIPGRFDFSEGETGTYISDGGGDMYDGGNYLSTDLGDSLSYSNGAITSSGLFGPGGRYFTRKYPGLFVLAADLDGVSGFTITGGLGADGSGSVDGAVFETTISGATYRGFVKRVFNAGDPSVNHLVIVPLDPLVSHEFSTYTDNDYHRVFGLGGVSRLYYLLYSTTNGSRVDDATTLSIMESFLRLLGAGWLQIEPDAGELAPGASLAAAVTFDASELDGGRYATTIRIRSNDPLSPEIPVPADLAVTGVPDITLYGADQQVESAVDFYADGAVTQHALSLVTPPSGGGTIELVADGDYGDQSEQATATAEGYTLGSVGVTGYDCSPADGSFPIAPAQLLELAADGVVAVEVRNTLDVGAFCALNRHTVRLRYRGSADRLDFGPLFIGLSRTLEIEVRNGGSDRLEVTSISSDLPEYTPSHASLSLAPRSSTILTVTFAPASTGPFDGTLTLASNDPDEPVTTVSLAGIGLEPPVLGVAPTELDLVLDQGTQQTLPLTLSNSGGSPLEFTAEVALRGPGLRRTTFTALSAGDGRSSNPPPVGAAATPAEPAPFRAADATFEMLPDSPRTLTCVAGDADGHAVYAQMDSGYEFRRFRTDAGTWERLADSPLHSSGNGGAALLGGRIYTSYTSQGNLIGVYEIATDSWTTRTHPVGAGTANLASDGERYIYFALNRRLVRYEPATLAWEDRAVPPFAFEPWGGLAYFEGKLYGHAGNGRRDFAVYDVAANAWSVLPALPAGAVLGAAIDPLAREYAAVGPYGGTNLYSFSLTDETWSVSTLPFAVDDGGLTWLPGRPSGLYLVQGERGTAFARRVGGPAWLRVAPDAGSVPAGQSAVLDVTFDSSLLLDGEFGAALEIRSNDPLAPLVSVPADLRVVGWPDLVLRGAEQRLESVLSYGTDGALTRHDLSVAVPPAGEGSLEVLADGDFGDYSELATVTAEGLALGNAGNTGTDCSEARQEFPLEADTLLALAADGVVQVEVQNTGEVGTFCTRNQHTVRLRYRNAGSSLDFGALFVGLSRTLEVEVQNAGTRPLEVSAISSDLPEFVPAETSLIVPPRRAAIVSVTFTPGAAQAFDGTLSFASNDPNEPVTTLALHGEGLVPPDIAIAPDSLAADLLTGGADLQTLTIENLGGSDLVWSAEVVFGDEGRVVSTSPVFRGPESGRAEVERVLPPPAGPPADGDLYSAGVAGPLDPAANVPAEAYPPALGAVLDHLDSRFAGVTQLIPDRFDFSEGVSGTSISDGGLNMFDNGNYLSSDLGGGLSYSDGKIVGATILGPAGRYFTRKHPGLFVFAGDVQGIQTFTISGYLGAGGRGAADGAVLDATVQGVAYRGFVKRVFDAGVPSVNHLVIVPFDPALDHEYDTWTSYDYHRVRGLQNVRRIYYLLYATEGGGYIDNATTLAIMKAFLEALLPPWLSVDPPSGTVPVGESAALAVRFDAAGLDGGDYAATIRLSSNDPDESVVRIAAALHVTAAPDILLAGPEQTLESAVDYGTAGALTQHAFPAGAPPVLDGTLELVADGDYGDYYERATASAEGLILGSVGATGTDCSTTSEQFVVSAADLALLASDGVVHVDVQNSFDVGSSCGVNRHTVRLSFRTEADRVEFGPVYIGSPRTIEIQVHNVGTAPLEVTAIASDRAEFVPSVASLTVAPRSFSPLTITFAPGAVENYAATLSLSSNDQDRPLATLALLGAGLVPPDIQVDPLALEADLYTGRSATRTLAIANGGGDTLRWTAEIDYGTGGRVLSASPRFAGVEPPQDRPKDDRPPDDGRPPADQIYTGGLAGTPAPAAAEEPARQSMALEDVLLQLDARFGEVTALVPNRFDFSEGVTGNSISDGGSDMYDGGNYLMTDLGYYLNYSDGSIRGSSLLGPTGRYFTRKVPGLFVLAADLDGAAQFTINGDLGADGGGSVGGSVLETTVFGTRYRGFVKRVFSTSDPSVNHLVIVPYDPAVGHEFSTSSNSDYHRVTGLQQVPRIYYLLYSSASGGYVDDATTLSIMEAFLRLLSPPWLGIEPAAGELVPGAAAAPTVSFDAAGLDGGDRRATIRIRSNDPDQPEVPVSAILRVTAAPTIGVAPDRLDFGRLYLGATDALPLTVRNDGTLPLSVSDVAPDDGAFTAEPRAFTVLPGGQVEIVVAFAPPEAREYSASLSIASDDPLQPVTTVALLGIGVVPPEIVITPPEFDESLYSDQLATRTLTIENAGGTDLVFRIGTLTRSGARRDAPDGAPGIPDDEPRLPPAPSETAGPPDRPLDPAGSVPPAALPLRDGFEDGDLLGWQLAMSPNLSEVTELTAAPGGRFSFHHRTVTDGVHLSGIYRDLGPVQPRYISFWVRSGSTGANDGYFVLRNRNADEVIWFFARADGRFYVNTDVGGDSSYPYAAQTWYHVEFRGIDFATKRFDYYVDGQLVRAGIPFRNSGRTEDVAWLDLYNWTPGSEAWWDEVMILAEEPPGWLRVEPSAAVVPPGGRLDVAVTFDATGLFGGDYAADLELTSNDPDESLAVVPVQLHVTGIPRIEARGPSSASESTVPFYLSMATTVHRFDVPGFPVDRAELELVADGDFGWSSEQAVASAEGQPIGSVGGVGNDCTPAAGAFAIDGATLAALAADGRVDVHVSNTYDVDPSLCSVNQHTVRFAFFGPSDRLDFGPVFVGTSLELRLELANGGTDTLTISSIVSDRGEVVPLVTQLDIPARGSALVPIVYSPLAEGPLEGTLRISSNDPFRSELALPLAGAGLIPPEIATRPGALAERLLPGDVVTVPVAIDNDGGSDLEFKVSIVPNAVRAGLPPAPEGAPQRSDNRPAGLAEAVSSPRTMAGAEVLIVEDVPPWNSSSSARILDLDGIPYDLVSAASLPATDLSRYRLIILSSDQPAGYYAALSGLGPELDQFVSAGGVLEFHAADGGWQYGDSSLVPVPGGLSAVTAYSGTNFLLDETHPIVTGVTSPIYASNASHAYLTGVPVGAVLLAADEFMRPTLLTYSHGAGLVVASGQTLEFLYSRGHNAGRLLVNMIPFSLGAARRWLAAEPLSGKVAPGASLDLTVTLDASGLSPGTYAGELSIRSNDPTTPRLGLPVNLAVVRLIAQGGPDQSVECEGGGANVTFDGSASRHIDGHGAILRYQWYEGDALLGEGERLAVELPLGSHAITLRISDAAADTSSDELLVQVVDTTPPAGRITAPAGGQCFGPAALPVTVTDSFTDACAGTVERFYSLPQGAVYTEHGDWSVGLVASDPSGNAAAEETVSFTIDTVPPAVDIIMLPARWTFPKFIPFQSIFVSGDDDRASGAVVHETIAVDGCVMYDGLTFGDGDGLLLDEVLPAAEDEMCRLVRLCGRRNWENPVVTVTVTDCGGNPATDTMIKPGKYYASPQRCP